MKIRVLCNTPKQYAIVFSRIFNKYSEENFCENICAMILKIKWKWICLCILINLLLLFPVFRIAYHQFWNIFSALETAIELDNILKWKNRYRWLSSYNCLYILFIVAVGSKKVINVLRLRYFPRILE